MHPELEIGPGEGEDLTKQSAVERNALAETIAARLDPAMGVLGIIFALVLLAQTLLTLSGPLGFLLSGTAWVLWAVFVAEFIVRLSIAPSTVAFLKRNWWQALFLLLPFLRLFRVLRAARFARAGRVLSSNLRAARGAGRVLSGRLGLLTAMTIIVIFGAAQLLVELGIYGSYADALYEASLNAITGQALGNQDPITKMLSVGLGIYSVVIFASLAGILGAYFFESTEKRDKSAGSAGGGDAK